MTYTQYDMDKAREQAFAEGYQAARRDAVRFLTDDESPPGLCGGMHYVEPGPTQEQAEIMARESGYKGPTCVYREPDYGEDDPSVQHEAPTL